MDISFVSVIYSFSFTTDSEHGVQTFNQSKLAIQKPAREICRRPFLENEDVCPHVIQILVDSCYCSGAFLHENHFFLASEKVSFLNAEAWKNLIEICLYHSQQSLKKQNAKKTRLHRRQIGRMQGKVEKRNQDPAKFILYSSWKYVINSY